MGNAIYIYTRYISRWMWNIVEREHRYLQSCVGTWARLGYAAFDAQLRKAYFVTRVYTVRYTYTSLLYRGSSHPVLVIWVRMIRNNLGNALVFRGWQRLWAKNTLQHWTVMLYWPSKVHVTIDLVFWFCFLLLNSVLSCSRTQITAPRILYKDVKL